MAICASGRRYGVYPLAVHRRSQNIGRQLDDLVVRVGDTLLLEGAPEDVQRLAADMELVDVSALSERAYRRGKSPIAIAAMAGIVILAAFNVAPILPLGIVAVAVVLLTGCIDADEAFSFVDGRLLALIFRDGWQWARRSIHTGAVALVVGTMAPTLEGLPPGASGLGGLFHHLGDEPSLYPTTPSQVIMAPIAIALAEATGVDVRPLLVAVMVAASACFATPIGYQTNMRGLRAGRLQVSPTSCGWAFHSTFRWGLWLPCDPAYLSPCSPRKDPPRWPSAASETSFPTPSSCWPSMTVTGCVAIGQPRPVESLAGPVGAFGAALGQHALYRARGRDARREWPGPRVRFRENSAICTVPLAYRVTADAGLNPLRLVFEEVFGAVGLGDAIAPAARGRDQRARRTPLAFPRRPRNANDD